MLMYPRVAAARNRQVAVDVAVLLAVLLFGWFGWTVHEALMELTAISTGLTDSLTGVQGTWNSVADSVSGVPLIGDNLADAFRGMSDATVGTAAESAQAVTEAVTQAARVLGLVTFAVPTVLLLVLWLPRRLARARRWGAADAVLSGLGPASSAGDPGLAGAGLGQVRELLALRALCRLDLADLAEHTPRPFEAYAAGDHQPLIDALLASEGMLAPPLVR